MRVVVFTAQPAVERSPWWSVLAATPGLKAVLVYRRRPTARAGAWRRFRANVRKHGLLWIPYRLGYMLVALAAAVLRRKTTAASDAAQEFEVETIETDDLSDPRTLAQVAAWSPDLGVSIGAPILKPAVFSVPVRGTINLHQGRVPDFRGAPPGFWELATGATEIGATVHWVDAGLDTGYVIAAATAPLYSDDSLHTVQARAEELGRIVLAEALKKVASGKAEGTPQPPGGHTYRLPLLKQRLRMAARLGWRRVRRALTPRAVAKVMAGLTTLLVLRPVRDVYRTATRRHPLRVFNYHRVTWLCRDGMTVAPDVFEQQLDFLRRHHDFVSLDEALEIARTGRRLRRPAALITFDDGYLSVFEAAWPAMRARGIRGCCFVPTELIGTDARLPHDDDSPVRDLLPVMSWAQVASLSKAGWDVGAHSATHARLSTLTGEPLRTEVDGPLATLRERLGRTRVTVAYPFGGRHDISEEALDRIRAAGYVACFSDVHGEIVPPADLFHLPRIEMGGDHAPLAWRLYGHGLTLERWR